jgi:ribosome-associated protein
LSFALQAASLAAQTRCRQVVVLDMRQLSPVADYFVICTGTSPRQMRTVADDLEEMAEPLGYQLFHGCGYEGESWVLLDFVDVIVHIFSDEARRFYDLENLWGDAPRVPWEGAAAEA